MSLDEARTEPVDTLPADAHPLTADGVLVAPSYLAPGTDPDFSARERPKPVTPSERVTSVDVLRGFALLGILAMNMHYNTFRRPLRMFTVLSTGKARNTDQHFTYGDNGTR